ncbi:VWA domain-containing protein [Caballeronia sp. M23-90]
MMFAVCASLMFGVMCTALDAIDYEMTQARMQMALDVATISAGVDLAHYADAAGKDSSAWKADARAFYNGNMPKGYLGLIMPDANFNATINGSPATGQTIQLSASGSIPLLAPIFFGKNLPNGGSDSGSGSPDTPDTTTVSAGNSAFRLPQSTLELALVLDNTGSMKDYASTDTTQGRKIDGLRSAANALVSSVLGQSGNRSYVGLVPFTTMVNVGASLASSGSWLTPAASDNNSYNSAGISSKYQASRTGTGWAGCPVEPRVGSAKQLYPKAYAPADSPGFTPFYYNVPPQGFKITTFDNKTNCTVTSVNNVLNVPLTYQTNGSTNLCGIVTSTPIYDAWGQPLATGKTPPSTTTWDQNGSGDPDGSSELRPCSIQPVQFLTQDINTLNSAINQMQANGSTIIPTGLLWGWRMVSSAWSPQVSGSNGWISSDANLPRPEATTQGLQRVVIVLTDGENDPGTANGIMPSPSFNGLSGVGNSTLTAPTGGPTNGSMTSVSDINTFQLSVCNAMKNEGITIYSITFGTYGTDSASKQAQQTMQSCASPGNYYHAPTNAALTSIFQQIAGNLGILRLTR